MRSINCRIVKRLVPAVFSRSTGTGEAVEKPAQQSGHDRGGDQWSPSSVVGGALRLMHDNPADSWTVASLAATGVSRAALARRFTEPVGTPPMAYLTEWRLALAADLLRERAATIGSVARQVGNGSAFALSTAVKRIGGVSPHRHRIAASGR